MRSSEIAFQTTSVRLEDGLLQGVFQSLWQMSPKRKPVQSMSMFLPKAMTLKSSPISCWSVNFLYGGTDAEVVCCACGSGLCQQFGNTKVEQEMRLGQVADEV